MPHPEARLEPFPLTDLQEAYWAGRLADLELSGVASEMYYEFDVPNLDLDRFRRAWQILVARHDVLRAVVDADGRQRILEDVPELAIPITTISLEDRDRVVDAVRDEMTKGTSSPEQWPLFEVRVSDMGVAGRRVHVRIDVLICDAQSALTLLRELAVLTTSPDTALPPLTVTFRDYQIWARQTTDAKRLAAAESYWLARADSLPGGPALPTIGAATVGPPRFSRRRGVLSKVSWQRLKDWAAAARLTAATVLLAAFSEVLVRWSREPHFSVNVTLFTRKAVHPDVQHIVGDFTSTTLVEIDGGRDATFSEFATRVQQQLWSDLEHVEWSGIRVMREFMRLQKGTPRARLPVVFTSHLNVTKEALPWREVYGVSQTPQVWLDHQVMEEDGGLRYQWDFVPHAFLPGVVEAMFESFASLLARLADDDAAWQGRRVWLLGCPAMPSSVPAGAATTSVLPIWKLGSDANAAVSTSARSLDYRELRQRALAVAHWIHDRGVGSEQLVAVVLEKGWEQVVAVAGILQAGAAYVPIDPRWPDARRRHVLEASRASLAITGQGWDTVLTWPAALLVTTVAALGRSERAQVPMSVRATQLAYVIYTSGSTGQPKGVMIAHGAAVNTIVAINARYGVTARDCVLSVSALHFDLSVYDIFGMLAAGATVALPSPELAIDPSHWAERMDAARVTIWNSVPALMEMLVEHVEQTGRTAPGALRLVLLSGDWIPLTLPDRIRRLWPHAQVVSLGGATEGAIWSIAYDIAAVDPAWTSVPYGKALPGQAVVVRDALERETPDWVEGELWIEGAGVARGYWGDPARTAQRFRRGGYRTGDLGRRWPDGTIQLLGRVDDQIKLQGFRIEPGEVEARLLAHPHVTAAAVVAAHSRLVAFYVPTPTGDSSPIPAGELQRWAAAGLPKHLVPTQFIPLAALPVTANGKVDRRALRPIVDVRPVSSRPAPGIEHDLIALCEQALGMDGIRAHDNFFHVGGDSVRAIRLHALVQRQMNVRLPLRDIFEHESLAQLATTIAAHIGDDDAPETKELLPPFADVGNRFEPFPLTDIQEAYWVGRREGFELGNVGSHAYAEYEAAELDVGRLERALQTLVDRHEMLRAVFLSDGRQQILRDPDPFRVAVEDLRAVTADQRAARLTAIRDELSHRCAAPQRWPLCHVRVTQLPGTVRIHVSFDLLVGDAWSVVILSDELARLLREEEPSLSAIECSFRDYVIGSSATAASQRAADMAYWKGRLAALPAAPALPVDVMPDRSSKPRFTRLQERLEQEAWQTLRQRAVESRLTPSAMLCAAYCEVLGAWSRTPQFTIVVTLFNRMPLHEHVDRLVGDFTSLTLLEVDLQRRPDFLSHALQLQRTLREHLEHPHVSGVRLQREIARLGRSPIPVVFTSTLGFRNDAAANTLPWTPVFGVSQTPQVWVDHQVAEDAGGLRYHWDVVEALFPPGVIASMFDCYARLLQRLARDPEAWHCSRASLLPQTLRTPTSLSLRDAFGREVPDWVSGEIWQGDVRTGDWARRRGDGVVERLRSADDDAAAARDSVDTRAIEARLLGHPQVAAAAVLVADRRLAAVYVPATSFSDVQAEEVDFRLQRRGVRRDLVGTPLPLPVVPTDEASVAALFRRRHSARRFEHRPVPLVAFGQFLSCLRSIELPESPFPKYRYASAGGLYPIQTYVLVRNDGVEGLSAGVYYYDPTNHALPPCSAAAGQDLVLDDPPAFMLFMVARMDAIAPIYGEAAERFCLLETGAMAHALELEAAECGIGLRQMGDLPFEVARPHLHLEPSDRYVHGLWGGCEAESGAAKLPPTTDLAAFLRQQLPAHEVPEVWLSVDSLPLRPDGDVDRDRLLRRLRAAEDADSPQPEADGGREQLIAATWAEVLERPVASLTRSESFFDAGGTSVLLVRLQARLERVLNHTIPLAVLLQGPTIREMATARERKSGEVGIQAARARAQRRLRALDSPP